MIIDCCSVCTAKRLDILTKLELCLQYKDSQNVVLLCILLSEKIVAVVLVLTD